MKQPFSFGPSLPLLKKAIFVDWNGVLSQDPFWLSILHVSRHPLHHKLKEATTWLFKRNNDIVNQWMRGERSAQDVVELLGVSLDRRFKHDFLNRKLVNDCQDMRVCRGLIDVLRGAADSAFVVIATDNMDCFYEQILCLRRKAERRRRQRRTEIGADIRLKDIVCYFDDILCSSALGMLKRDIPVKFFGPWLKVHSLGFENALLLDDVETNCSVFRSIGGAAIRVVKEDFQDGFQRVNREIAAWIGCDISGSNPFSDPSQKLRDEGSGVSVPEGTGDPYPKTNPSTAPVEEGQY